MTGRAGRLCLQAGWLSACPAGAGDAGKGQANMLVPHLCSSPCTEGVCVPTFTPQSTKSRTATITSSNNCPAHIQLHGQVSCKHVVAEVLLTGPRAAVTHQLLSCKLQLAEKELQVAMLKSIIRDSEDTAVLQQQLAEVGRRTQRA